MTDICWNYKELKKYNQALDYCDRAIEFNQNNARAWLGRSHVYYYGFQNAVQAKKDSMIYKGIIARQKKQQ